MPRTWSFVFNDSFINNARPHVPASAINYYKKYASWNKFKEIVVYQPEGITNDIAQVETHTVMIQSDGGLLNIHGADDGSPNNLYSVNGSLVGSAVNSNGHASINSTTMRQGSIAIVEIGQKVVKVVVR